MRKFANREAEQRYYHRLGSLIADDGPMNRFEPRALMSRALQIAGTWRSHLAWHLANALGWR